MLPHYIARCHSQDLGFKGPNLAEKRRVQIRVEAADMNADRIHKLGGDRFHVDSATDSTRRYLVDLSDMRCDCPDWPRVRLCKHVSAVEHHFGNNVQRMGAAEAAEGVLPKTLPPNQEAPPDAHAGATTASILENVISVSRDTLNHSIPTSMETIRSLREVEAHLTAVVRSTHSTESPVPDKEDIPPNQRSSMWAETAKRMGATRGKKKRARAGSDTTPQPPATERIGLLNRKQACVKFTDPYSGGVSSGRVAKPDVRSATNNAETRVCATAAANSAGVSQQLSGPVPTPSALLHPPSVPPSHALPAWYTGTFTPSVWRPIPVPFPPTPYTYPYLPYTYFPPSGPSRP